jgi:hypothetical protein
MRRASLLSGEEAQRERPMNRSGSGADFDAPGVASLGGGGAARATHEQTPGAGTALAWGRGPSPLETKLSGARGGRGPTLTSDIRGARLSARFGVVGVNRCRLRVALQEFGSQRIRSCRRREI